METFASAVLRERIPTPEITPVLRWLSVPDVSIETSLSFALLIETVIGALFLTLTAPPALVIVRLAIVLLALFNVITPAEFTVKGIAPETIPAAVISPPVEVNIRVPVPPIVTAL
jgi:hypothetical protein